MTTPAQGLKTSVQDALGKVVFGMEDIVHHLCLALIARGHVLLEGVPGLGKTLLAKTLAAHLGGKFKRIQCTADLMPSDITGIHVFHSQKNEFVFMPGPIFADIVLVDEINRTGPKTQSALLQAMEEGAVTIDRDTHKLPENFFVIASQNPHEFEGTYPLPESQMDRFLLRLDMHYPRAEMEQQVLRSYDLPGGGHDPDQHDVAQLSETQIVQAREQVQQVFVSDAVYDYVVTIANTSRAHPQVSLGLSTRGALGLMRCARIEAALQGQPFVTPDHVKAVAKPVMVHRLVLTPDATLEGVGGADVVDAILGQVKVPRSSDAEPQTATQ